MRTISADRRLSAMTGLLGIGWVIATLQLSGCATRDASNQAAVPWARPTKAEMSRSWWFAPNYTDPQDRHPWRSESRRLPAQDELTQLNSPAHSMGPRPIGLPDSRFARSQTRF
jgi:hypothetical protein